MSGENQKSAFSSYQTRMGMSSRQNSSYSVNDSVNPAASISKRATTPAIRDTDTSSTGDESEIVGSLSNSIESLKPSVIVFVLALLTSFCGFMFGYDTGYISGALVIIKQDLGRTLTSGDKEYITSATSLAALLAALIGGSLADAFGRKWVIAAANIMFITGGGIQTGAHTLWTMIAGRFVMGWGVGLASLVAPMYLSELAPTRFRGRLVVMNVLAITFGQLVAYAIGAGLTHVHNGWRILVGLSLVPSVIQGVLFLFMPETPRYLVLRGKNEEARRVLARVYQGASANQLTAKIAEIQSDVPRAAVTHEVDNPGTAALLRSAFITLRHNIRDLFTIPSNLRALGIVVCLQLFQQFSGWNALMYYSGTVFDSVGFSDPTAVSIIIAGTNFVFTCLAFLIIDRVGRRVLLVGTMWGMALGLTLCAIAFHYLPFDISTAKSTSSDTFNGPEQKWSIVVIVFIFFYAASYATGIGNVPWQQAEMLPMEVRGVGTSLSTAANWAGSLIISSTFLTMLQNITPSGTFGFFAAICALGEICAIFLYPETAGLNLEEIQGLLRGGFQVRESIRLSKQKKQLYRSQ